MNKNILKTFFETLNKDISLSDYRQIYARDVYFKDPFNQTYGVHAIYEIFKHMYAKLDFPRFQVLECICDHNICYVKWCFIFCFKGETKEHSFEGISRMQYNDEKQIISHIDYWDSAEHVYEKIPLLGSLIRFIKRTITK